MPKLEPEIFRQRMQAFHEKRMKLIEEHGWYIQGVFPTEEGEKILWNYTVGMADKFGFELLVFGLYLETAQPMLNDLGADCRRGEMPVLNVPVSATRWFRGDIKIMFRECKKTRELYHEWCAQATAVHGREDYRVLQIVLCDKNGKFPGDVGYDEQGMGKLQPLLF